MKRAILLGGLVGTSLSASTLNFLDKAGDSCKMVKSGSNVVSTCDVALKTGESIKANAWDIVANKNSIDTNLGYIRSLAGAVAAEDVEEGEVEAGGPEEVVVRGEMRLEQGSDKKLQKAGGKAQAQVVLQPEVMGLSAGGSFQVARGALTKAQSQLPAPQPPKLCPGDGCSGNGACDIVTGTCK